MKTIQVNEQMFRIILGKSGRCECVSSGRIEVSHDLVSRAFRGAAKGTGAEITYGIEAGDFGRSNYSYTFNFGGKTFELFSAPIEAVQAELDALLDTARAAPSSNE